MKNSSTQYMNHITLTTGHNRKSPRSEVSQKTIDLIAPWLKEAIKSEKPISLPRKDLSNYTALVSESDDGLIVSVFGQSKQIENGRPLPLVTFHVVRKEGSAAEMWKHAQAPYMLPIASGLKCPAVPFAAVSTWPTSFMFFDALVWLGDFERCVAWTWLEQQEIEEEKVSPKEDPKAEAPIPEAPAKNDFTLICVGKPLPNPFPEEGPKLLMQQSGLSIILNINDPDDYEKNALSSSSYPIKIGYASHDRLGILLLDFKGFSFDLPFDAGIENPESIPDLTIKSNQDRILLSIISADSARSHKVIGIRHITMSPRVSRLVSEKIAKQAASPISVSAYSSLVDQIYRKFPTTKDILKSALAMDKAGND